MSKKITQIIGCQFSKILKPAVALEFEKSESYKSIDNEVKEYLDYGYGDLADKVSGFIQSGKFGTFEYLSDACIAKLDDGIFKMFITMSGHSRKTGDECTKDFSCFLNIVYLNLKIKSQEEWESNEVRILGELFVDDKKNEEAADFVFNEEFEDELPKQKQNSKQNFISERNS